MTALWEDLTELEQLRQSNDALRQQLYARDVAESLKKLKEEADRRRAQEIAAVEAEGAERAASMEAHRRRSWFDYELGECQRTHDDARFWKLCTKSIPQHDADAPEGWAPGFAPAMYMDVPAFAPTPAAEDADTQKWLAGLGVKLS